MLPPTDVLSPLNDPLQPNTVVLPERYAFLEPANQDPMPVNPENPGIGVTSFTALALEPGDAIYRSLRSSTMELYTVTMPGLCIVA
jgi:hypothetical protein